MNIHPHSPVYDGERVIEPGNIVFRTQSEGDRKKLYAVCPVDQTKLFRGRWDGLNFVLEEAPKAALGTGLQESPEDAADKDALAKLVAMKVEDLKTLAATVSVKWDKNASIETMAQRILEAQKTKAVPGNIA